MRRTGTILLALLAGGAAVAGQDAGNRALIERTDAYLQGRFEQDAGKFGMARLPPISRHEPVRLSEYDRDGAAVTTALRQAGRGVLVAFIHTRVPPRARKGADDPLEGLWWFDAGRATYIKGQRPEPDPLTSLRPEILRESSKASAGKAITIDRAGWTLALRPVKASKASCVSCHAGIREGDTLGIMVYAVQSAKATTASRPATR